MLFLNVAVSNNAFGEYYDHPSRNKTKLSYIGKQIALTNKGEVTEGLRILHGKLCMQFTLIMMSKRSGGIVGEMILFESGSFM